MLYIHIYLCVCTYILYVHLQIYLYRIRTLNKHIYISAYIYAFTNIFLLHQNSQQNYF
jgi:hypothetical protein